MKTDFRRPALLITVALLSSSSLAEKAPLSTDRLEKEADTIIVGTITDLHLESEPSRFEPGFGNFDWGIYLTLRVERGEKGNLPKDQIEARCFRIKFRRSVLGYLAPSGHHPIPGTGTRVRAYLQRQGRSWRVVLPNGITAVSTTSPETKLGASK